jgi:hypothetical protein
MSNEPGGKARLIPSSAIGISGFSMMSVSAVAMGNLIGVASKSKRAGVCNHTVAGESRRQE